MLHMISQTKKKSRFYIKLNTTFGFLITVKRRILINYNVGFNK